MGKRLVKCYWVDTVTMRSTTKFDVAPIPLLYDLRLDASKSITLYKNIFLAICAPNLLKNIFSTDPWFKKRIYMKIIVALN